MEIFFGTDSDKIFFNCIATQYVFSRTVFKSVIYEYLETISWLSFPPVQKLH